MEKGRPITTDEIITSTKTAIPGFVFDVVNQLITENYNKKKKVAYIKLEELTKAIKKRTPKNTTFDKDWLLIELDYEEVGWQVGFSTQTGGKSYYSFYNKT